MLVKRNSCLGCQLLGTATFECLPLFTQTKLPKQNATVMLLCCYVAGLRNSYHGYQAEVHRHGRRSSHDRRSKSHSRSSDSKETSQTAPLSGHVTGLHHQTHSRSQKDGPFQPHLQAPQTVSNSDLYLQNYNAELWPGLSSSKV